MLQIGPAVEAVGDRQKHGLCGNAAQRVPRGKLRRSGEGRRNGGRYSRERGRRTEEKCAGKRLSQTGAAGQPRGLRRESGTKHCHRRGGYSEHEEVNRDGPA